MRYCSSSVGLTMRCCEPALRTALAARFDLDARFTVHAPSQRRSLSLGRYAAFPFSRFWMPFALDWAVSSGIPFTIVMGLSCKPVTSANAGRTRGAGHVFISPFDGWQMVFNTLFKQTGPGSSGNFRQHPEAPGNVRPKPEGKPVSVEFCVRCHVCFRSHLRILLTRLMRHVKEKDCIFSGRV